MDLEQYYPTPPSLVRRMLGMFNNKNFVRMLEPESGRGDMAEIAQNHLKYHGGAKVDCIELDVSKHANLKERKLNVVGVDFLQFKNGSLYSHVLMNPPFRVGVKHLLHAWSIVWDAEIVCALNAQTLKNDFSAERQHLKRLIAMHGHVEYVTEAFMSEDTQRPTNVEVALVYLRKEADINTTIIGDLLAEMTEDEEGEETLGKDFQRNQDIAIPTSVLENSVRVFNAAVKTTREAIYAQAKANYYTSLLGDTLAAASGQTGSDRPTEHTVKFVRETFTKAYEVLKDRAWTSVLRSSDVEKRLSSAGQKQLEAGFEDVKKLEFTLSNIYGFILGLIQNQSEINDTMVLDVFTKISQYHSDNTVFYRGYKSNDRHRSAGMRVKSTRFILPYMGGTDRDLDYDARRLLQDFDRVMALLHADYEVENGLRHAAETRMEELYAAQRVSTKYFDIRWYRGVKTMHFYPRSQEVMDRLNRYVGRLRQWLPPEGVKVHEDFWLQYAQAERFDAQVREATKKTVDSRRLQAYIGGYGQPGVADQSLKALDDALTKVHESHGLDIDGLLTYESEPAQLQLTA